jgi:hypothetical protein
MRFIEIRGGLSIPVSSEEQDLLERIEESDEGMVDRTSLSERERELARKMVSRGVLNRSKNDGNIFYLKNDLEDLWRI